MHRALCILIPVILSPAPAMSAPWTDELRAALNTNAEGPIYAYEMTYDDGDVRASGIVDVSQPAGQRIKIISPAISEWPEGFAKELAELDATAKGDIWCNSVGENIPDDVTLLNEDEMTTTYGFKPLPDADADSTERKVFRHLSGTVTIARDNPAVLGFRLWADKSFKPMVLARINSFDMSMSCKRAPDGRTYVEKFNIAIAGKAMGRAFSQTEERVISKLLHALE